MSDQRNMREIISAAALRRLETELHAYAHKIPRRTLPEYTPGAPKDALPLPVDVKDESVIDRIYSRSDKQRYVLQLLATELHQSEEKSRDFIPFQTFKEVLGSPIGQDLSKLDPQVEDYPKRLLAVAKVKDEIVVEADEPVATLKPQVVDKSRNFGRLIVDSTYSNIGRGIRVVQYQPQ